MHNLFYLIHEVICIGTWPTFGPGVTEEQAEQVIILAVDSGINVFDLSEAHSGLYRLVFIH